MRCCRQKRLGFCVRTFYHHERKAKRHSKGNHHTDAVHCQTVRFDGRYAEEARRAQSNSLNIKERDKRTCQARTDHRRKKRLAIT